VAHADAETSISVAASLNLIHFSNSHAGTVLLVIASEAKQSIVPQLTKLDCFAALAMTAGQSGVPHVSAAHSSRSACSIETRAHLDFTFQTARR
jgi:hypothetical protein